jgi:hypothetical protein
LISETPSSVLLMEAGPQIPAGPDSPTKLAMRNFLRSPRARSGPSAGPGAPSPIPENPLSSHSGDIDGAPETPNCVSESNSLSFQLTSGADQTTIGEVIDNKKYRSGKY